MNNACLLPPLPQQTGTTHENQTQSSRKGITVGVRGSGLFGDFLPLDPASIDPNSNKRKRRSRERLFGIVVCFVGNDKWFVQFDNVTSKECSANTLSFDSW